MEDRLGPDGTIKAGLRPALYKWCKDRQKPSPDMSSDLWTAALPGEAEFKEQLAVKQICWHAGLEATAAGCRGWCSASA